MKTFSTSLRACAFIFAGFVAGSALTGTAWAIQSHMVAARDHLNMAYSQLNAAVADKAGHRANAMKLVQQAIGEVNAGITAAAGK